MRKKLSINKKQEMHSNDFLVHDNYSSLNTSCEQDQELTKQLLREEVISSIERQGFNIKSIFNKDFDALKSKEVYKKLQLVSALEERKANKKMLTKFTPTILPYLKNLNEINPDKISLQLIEVTSGSLYEKIYKWWNLAWWSMPYQKAYGRQMRFIIWDKYHNAPFGLIGLQSPILKIAPRDKYLNIPTEELDLWVNQSMNAQRIGALPPYNELIGGKMASLALISKELRLAYKNKYTNATTLMKNRKIKPELLFLTTTSAFGRSSIYNRLKIDNHLVAKSLGYTKGYGSFHINKELFKKLLELLESHNINTQRSFGSGPSKRIKLLNQAFRLLDIPGLEQHGLKREFFIFENVKNIHDIIYKGAKPKYYDYKFTDLAEFWKKRWCKKRYEKVCNSINTFNKDDFVKSLSKSLD